MPNGLTFKNARGQAVEHFFHRSCDDFGAAQMAWEAGRRHFDPRTETFHAAPLRRISRDPGDRSRMGPDTAGRDYLAEPIEEEKPWRL